MKSHPFADILPLLEGEAFNALVANIRAKGLMEPITIHQGMILDGRNRWKACKAAGVEPQFLEFDGDDPLAFVLSMNLHRRHLSEAQRAMVAAEIATLGRGAPKKSATWRNIS
jgi:ParB-like chromosome segregation protein Spo0J